MCLISKKKISTLKQLTNWHKIFFYNPKALDLWSSSARKFHEQNKNDENCWLILIHCVFYAFAYTKDFNPHTLSIPFLSYSFLSDPFFVSVCVLAAFVDGNIILPCKNQFLRKAPTIKIVGKMLFSSKYVIWKSFASSYSHAIISQCFSFCYVFLCCKENPRQQQKKEKNVWYDV